MTYKELLDKHIKEADEFSKDKIYFIFGSENEIYEKLRELGHAPEDFIYIGGGGFLLKEYKNEFYNLIDRQAKEKKDYLMANVYEVVNYYYWDYEVYISLDYNYTNILTELLGMTPEEIEANKDEINRAREDYIREFEKLNIQGALVLKCFYYEIYDGNKLIIKNWINKETKQEAYNSLKEDYGGAVIKLREV